MKQPYYISLKSGEPLAMGGLWESWKAPDGTILRTACIITMGPNAIMEPIHDRMPVILRPEDWHSWLDAPASEVAGMITPYGAEEMQAWPVDRRVSRTVDDDAGLIAQLDSIHEEPSLLASPPKEKYLWEK